MQATPLGLVLNELVANVLKYAFPGSTEGLIEVSARRTAHGLTSICVRDNGIGVPENFDLDHCETLGLSIVRDIVRVQLDGNVALRRANGTEVRIEIPTERKPVQKRTAEREQMKKAKESRLKVMVVEDELLVSMEIQTILKSFGHTVSAAVDTGEEAVQRAAEDKPDLVLMDFKLKGKMNGIHAAAEIQKSRPVPVLFVSAVLDENDELLRSLPGPYGCMPKPFEGYEFSTAVKKLFPDTNEV